MNNKYIRDFITESEIVSLEDLKKVDDYVFEKNVDFLDALVEIGFLNQETLSKIYAKIMGINKINLGEKIVSFENFKKIPEVISQEHNLICFCADENTIDIAFCDIKSLEVLEDIFPANINSRFFLAEHKDIIEKKEEYMELVSEELFFKNQKNVDKISKIKDWGIRSEKDLPDNFRKDIANDLYTEKFITGILDYAINNKADFVFFNSSEEDIVISIRIAERNYNLMKVDKGVLFSILLKLKQLSDVNIFEEFQIKQSSFTHRDKKQKYDIFLTFVKTDFGESVTIQVSKNKKFKTEQYSLVTRQREDLLHAQKKDSGFLVVSGENDMESKKTLYSFLEFDIEKNKEIYLLEKEILLPLNYTKQILIENPKSVLSFLSRIFSNFPDVLFVDNPSVGVLPMLFNYVSTSKKAFVSNDMEIGKFLEMLLDNDFDKGQIVKNLSLFIEHKDFEKINPESREKFFLKKEEINIIKNFLTEKEVSDIFKKEGLEKASEQSLAKVKFFVKKTGGKRGTFSTSENYKEKVSVRGITNLGLFLENGFIKRYSPEKIKNSLRKEVKKSVLENAILASYRGEIDMREVLKYLTSY